VETPIIFYERNRGRSKIHPGIILEALIGVIRLTLYPYPPLRLLGLYSSMSDVWWNAGGGPPSRNVETIMSDRRAQIDRWIEQGAIGEARSG